MMQPLQIDMNQPNNAVNGGQGAANAGAGGNANALPHFSQGNMVGATEQTQTLRYQAWQTTITMKECR